MKTASQLRSELMDNDCMQTGGSIDRFIQQIQLDAMKEGMRRAANECDKRVECTGNGQRWWEDRKPNEIKKYILTTAEQLTEKDL